MLSVALYPEGGMYVPSFAIVVVGADERQSGREYVVCVIAVRMVDIEAQNVGQFSSRSIQEWWALNRITAFLYGVGVLYERMPGSMWFVLLQYAGGYRDSKYEAVCSRSIKHKKWWALNRITAFLETILYGVGVLYERMSGSMWFVVLQYAGGYRDSKYEAVCSRSIEHNKWWALNRIITFSCGVGVLYERLIP